ncbi:BTAD domain-containing putative transcriptional regulator, partial [Nonomuraea angiospora]
MRFGVLGPLAVWTDAGESVTVPGLKVRALLVDLLVHEGHPVSADRLVDDLWGAEPPGNPAGALQVRVSQLRKAFEDAEPGGKNLVVSRAPGYLLRHEDGAVDAARFAALLARAEASDSPRTRAGLLADALALWRGPAYADFADEEYTRSAILRLEEQRLSALEQHAEARLELGEHGLLVGELGDLVARHPLRERLRAVHMRALYRAGRQSEALASYGELRDRLADELGLDPGPELVALHQAILGQDPALSVPADRPVTNLPAPVSKLIGRDEALAEVCALVGDERLVTLTGSGGVGKTRLALEAANRLVDGFADGAWLVALDQASRSPVEAVTAALDIREDAASADPLGPLAAALRARRMLLVLDNCEHVVEQVAELAEALLRACPDLRILATSREPLAVAGEVLWSVPPLDVPGSADLAVMARSDAVRLFVTRAAASARGFALDARNAAAVAQLCRRLDGIPLALELAATRVRALGVQGVVARLDDRFKLLASGQRGAPARQQTLTAVIDWSWELLSEDERRVLRRLAAHADGCTLEAAESVCDAPELDVLDLLARLVDRSLVVVVEAPAGVRYRLLESVSEYCRARLSEAGELDRVRLAHLRHYLALAVAAEPELYGHDQRDWLLRLDAEAANLRAALDTAVAGKDADAAARLVNALAWYWFLRGRLAEGRRSLAAALSVEGDASPVRARAAAWEAGFALMLGEEVDWKPVLAAVADPGDRARAELFVSMHVKDMPTGQELVGRALSTFRETGDRWGVAAALARQARDAFTTRDIEALERTGEESARLFTELGDRWGLLQATAWLASLAEMATDAERATRLFGEGLRMAEDLGLWPEVSTRIAWLGWIAMQTGDYDRSMEFCERAMKLAQSQGYVEGAIMGEMGLAFTARRAGLLDLAETHLRRLLEGVPRGPGVEPPLYVPDTLIELGYLTELRGDPAAAMELHVEALAAARRMGDVRTMAFAVEGAAAASGP